MISAERKKLLAAQLRRIAEQDSPATEWRAIALTFRELAEHIDTEPVQTETKKSRRHRRKRA